MSDLFARLIAWVRRVLFSPKRRELDNMAAWARERRDKEEPYEPYLQVYNVDTGQWERAPRRIGE